MPAPLVIDDEEVARALDDQSLIDALRDAFRAGGEVPVRHHHDLPRPGRPDLTFLLMPAWQAGKALGTKLVTIAPGNEASGLPSVQATYLLFDATTGSLLAVLAATELTLRRTASASALASSYLARADASHLVLMGAGALAPHLVRAHRQVRPLRRVTLWNRTQARAERLARELDAPDLEVVVTEDRASAVAAADIVTCCTMSREPVLEGRWLRPGTHVDLVGAFRPDMREADDEAVRRARVFVDTRSGALSEAGDIVQPLKDRLLGENDIVADLFELARGVSGREDGEEITLFKSVGTALEDLAAALLVFARTG